MKEQESEMADKEMRAVYAETLIELAKTDPCIMVLEADLMKSSGTMTFREVFPERAIDVGVAESNMVSLAAGLAAEGKKPFAATFGCFASQRALDQFFVSCAYAKLPVKLVGTDPGISAAINGGTHMPFEDLGIMRLIPGVDIVEPSDPISLEGMIRALANSGRPGYLRLYRKAAPSLYQQGETFSLGHGKLLRSGKDAVIVALGAIMVQEALGAANLLANEHIDVAVIDALSLKPLDVELIVKWVRATGVIVTAENHQVAGGLGSAVAELIADGRCGEQTPQFGRIGIHDEFGEVGTQEWLKEHFGLTADNIAAGVQSLVAKRNKL